MQEDQLRLEGLRPGQKNFGVDPESHYGTLTTREYEKAPPDVKKYPTVQPATYVEFYRIFGKALQGQGEVPVKAEDARDVLHLLELAQQSSKEDRTITV